MASGRDVTRLIADLSSRCPSFHASRSQRKIVFSDSCLLRSSQEKDNMKTLQHTIAVLVTLLLLASSLVNAFTDPHVSSSAAAFLKSTSSLTMSSDHTTPSDAATPHHPFCDLPGDPSLILTTNVDLGAKKLEIMKGKKKTRNHT